VRLSSNVVGEEGFIKLALLSSLAWLESFYECSIKAVDEAQLINNKKQTRILQFLFRNFEELPFPGTEELRQY